MPAEDFSFLNEIRKRWVPVRPPVIIDGCGNITYTGLDKELDEHLKEYDRQMLEAYSVKMKADFEEEKKKYEEQMDKFYNEFYKDYYAKLYGVSKAEDPVVEIVKTIEENPLNQNEPEEVKPDVVVEDVIHNEEQPLITNEEPLVIKHTDEVLPTITEETIEEQQIPVVEEVNQNPLNQESLNQNILEITPTMNVE